MTAIETMHSRRQSQPHHPLATWLFALFCVAASPQFIAAEYRYEKVNYPGSESTVPRGINARGDIVGGYLSEGYSHGFLLRNGVFKTIDFPGSPRSQVMDINDDGVIVRRYVVRDGAVRGFKAKPQDGPDNEPMVSGHRANVHPGDSLLVHAWRSGTPCPRPTALDATPLDAPACAFWRQAELLRAFHVLTQIP